MAKKKEVFPTFAVIVLVIAVLWTLEELGVIASNAPWFPIALGIVAVSWIIEFYHKKG